MKTGWSEKSLQGEFQPPRPGIVTRCEDTTEAVPLCPRLRLCLKPSAYLGIAVHLPPLTDKCRSISNWEVMEQLRSMAKPGQLGQLRVQSSSLEAMRFDCELPSRQSLADAIKRLDGGRIKLAGFADFLRVRATELRPPCPSKYDWETFFRDAQGLDCTQPGERPDTVIIGQLPCAWFAESDEEAAAEVADAAPPSVSAVTEAFASFGPIRRLEIPMLEGAAAADCCPTSTTTLGRFDAFIQFADCAGFERCLAGLRCSKLLLLASATAATTATATTSTLAMLPTLDFDRRGRLSERALRSRAAARRRAERERERLARAEEAALRARIAAEERGILVAQRKLESVRLLGELFRRLREARDRDAMKRREARLRRKLLSRRQAAAAGNSEIE